MDTIAPHSVPIVCCWRKPKGLDLQLIWKRKLIIFSPFPGWGLSEYSIHWKTRKSQWEKCNRERNEDKTYFQEPGDSVPVKMATLLTSKIQMQSFAESERLVFTSCANVYDPKNHKLKARHSTEELRGTQWLRARTHKTMLVTTEGHKCLHYDS